MKNQIKTTKNDTQYKSSSMMEQWATCKQKAKDALLLFRLGDFYEAFYEDAQLISKELDLTLTQRQQVAMCGVPYHAHSNYVDKLIAKGYKVAIAEQMEDPKTTKGLVKREVVRIITPATVVNSTLISDKNNNFFISLSQFGKTFGICICDLTTSEFRIIEVDYPKKLADELFKLRPKELLVSKKFQNNHKILLKEISYHFNFVLNTKEDWHFDYKTNLDILLSHFHVHTLDGFGIKGMVAGIIAAGTLYSHLTEELNLNLDHIQKITSDAPSSYMELDYTCLYSLELIEPIIPTNKKTTLLYLLDKTLTPMGGRLLKSWIKYPLLCPKGIKQRQEGVQELIAKDPALGSPLSSIKDLERLIMKIKSGYSTPKDLASLRFSLEKIPLIKETLKAFSAQLIVEDLLNLKDIDPIVEIIKKAIVDSPPLRLGDGSVIRDGYDVKLDELRTIKRDSRLWIVNYQNTLKEKLQIKTLKVGYNKVFGYYIEVSKSQAPKMPQDFHRKQTLVNNERFISDELKNFEHKILTAEERIKAIETTLYREIIEKISNFSKIINTAAQAIARLDTLFSLATVAKEYNYLCPTVDESDCLHIQEGRHPIVESSNTNKFIPNNTYMDNHTNQLLLITGPNMAGKSTYIRQVALIIIMAQMGSFVPAKFAHIGIIDKLFCRIGASDNLAQGQSTFMVEMIETANILNNATSRSLVILDEIGRGTSTYDGISIAWAVVEFLLSTTTKRAKTLFATHYWELTELEKKIKGVINFNVAVKETNLGILFLRKIIKGRADKSYGIHVAQLAGIPSSVIKRAKEILIELEKNHTKKQKREVAQQFLLFPHSPKGRDLDPLLEEIEKIDINQTTPMQALQKLSKLQQLANAR